MKNYSKLIIFLLFVFIFSCANQGDRNIEMKDMYPWCVVMFDSIERTPAQRIHMLKDMGFVKYAYDWKDKHLDDMESEFQLAKENNIEIISVWLWLNAKRDSLGKLSPSNNRMFDIVKKSQLKTTLWLSFSNNFFEDRTQEQSMETAIEMIKFVNTKAKEIGCDIALYNHRGWFGNPNNQVEIIKALPEYNLKMVYNFHHAHDYLEDFPQIIKKIKPYLASVNLNGMKKEGSKILPIGSGDYETEMIKLLIMDEVFDGPWGILGHVENDDAKSVLERNIEGLNSLMVGSILE
ncbi:hypothetical protein Q4Q35_08785 [Flavivirga aquimarina]|uniref:Xylose isomerase-like TIM barrel domain-containing protein n=1 Tax=Flavivirga aquimarina TaxID=2027862 RepID=A0ABT8W9T9_9FLAO|nr:hypothetical protein [Flavivirga aquimarina]MDO5969903.1 hypothetical protein [Flavivirga aquimarina]